MPWSVPDKGMCTVKQQRVPGQDLSGSVTSLLRESTSRRSESISHRTAGNCERSLSWRWTCAAAAAVTLLLASLGSGSENRQHTVLHQQRSFRSCDMNTTHPNTSAHGGPANPSQ